MPPAEQPNPNQSGDYDFFLNPAPPPKPGLFSQFGSGGRSSRQRMMIVLGGFVALIVIAMLFVSLVFGGSSTNSTDLLHLAQAQNELIHLATTGSAQASQQTVKNLAINTEISLTSAQQQLVGFMKSHGISVNTKQLALTKNPTIDQQLQAAQAASNFDAIFVQVLQQQLATYIQTAQQTAQATTLHAERMLLNTQSGDGQLLLTQAKAVGTTL